MRFVSAIDNSVASEEKKLSWSPESPEMNLAAAVSQIRSSCSGWALWSFSLARSLVARGFPTTLCSALHNDRAVVKWSINALLFFLVKNFSSTRSRLYDGGVRARRSQRVQQCQGNIFLLFKGEICCSSDLSEANCFKYLLLRRELVLNDDSILHRLPSYTAASLVWCWIYFLLIFNC